MGDRRIAAVTYRRCSQSLPTNELRRTQPIQEVTELTVRSQTHTGEDQAGGERAIFNQTINRSIH